ncbi:MAG TPA: flagellar export chaperone FlgN [Tepidisphaeraceae bacterium]|jgi:hypothetical protein
MSRPLLEVESILQQLIVEHRKLLKHVESHQAAMRCFDLKAMDDAAKLQEGARLRITMLENKRKAATVQAAKLNRLEGDLTLKKLADLNPARAPQLLALRDELKTVVTAIAARTHVAGRIAGAVLGHLNTVVRLLAGAVEQAGVYTKHGVPQVSARIGVMEAVG